ncbi:hypothetical protein GO986_21850 [Deinococcus sp. HMF7620]|uniref:Uncharacterized protein n=1 Tax=Deinococcus arboris TaxID=2682977 RepID=A0A7C9MBU6_9DEIO|nr:hypothetical protein [Deinococcus arboris]MVN89383.1 hypothetical protein [Deinococcus arboris]
MESASKVSDLFEKIVHHLPGLTPLWPGSRQQRLSWLGEALRFERYLPPTTPGYQAPSTPKPSRGVQPIQSQPALTPKPGVTPAKPATGTAPKPAPGITPALGIGAKAGAAVGKAAQAARTVATNQTTVAVTRKATQAASANPLPVLAGIGVGVLLAYAQQGRGA